MIKIILAAGFKVPFIFTAQAQVVSCVHMNDAKRSHSNINDKDRRAYFSPESGDGPSEMVLFCPDALLTDSLDASTDSFTVCTCGNKLNK